MTPLYEEKDGRHDEDGTERQQHLLRGERFLVAYETGEKVLGDLGQALFVKGDRPHFVAEPLTAGEGPPAEYCECRAERQDDWLPSSRRGQHQHRDAND